MTGALANGRISASYIGLLACLSIALSACSGGGEDKAGTSAPSAGGSQPTIPVPTPSTPSPTPDPEPTPSPSPSPAPTPEPEPEPQPAPSDPEPSPTPANRAPQISGTALGSVTVNSSYTFTPAASDPDGDELMFSIENKPEWATFDTLSGKLSGTPQQEHVGNYEDIVISVTDGQATAALPAFTIAVTQASSGKAVTLSWNAPTQNEDGSALTDLAGYMIVYGPSSTMLHESVQVDEGLTMYVLEGLSPGTYYFAVKAFNDSGVESGVSNIVSHTVE